MVCLFSWRFYSFELLSSFLWFFGLVWRVCADSMVDRTWKQSGCSDRQNADKPRCVEYRGRQTPSSGTGNVHADSEMNFWGVCACVERTQKSTFKSMSAIL